MMRVYLRHFSALKYCHKGCRKFFERHNLMPWSDFLRDGIDEDDLAGTGDAMALDAVAFAKQEQANESTGG